MPPDLFRGLSNLQRIDLHENNLSSVPPDLFRGLSNLQRIDLDENNLSSVPPDLFRGLSSLEIVYIKPGNDELTCSPQLPEGASYYSYSLYYDDTRVNLPPCDEDKVEITINKKTLRIEDPLSQVDFAAVLTKLADVVSGRIFSSKAKKKETEGVEQVIDGIERVVNIVEYVIDADSLANAVVDLLASGDFRTQLQVKLDELIGTENYTVQLDGPPEESLTVSITSDQPNAFVITPEALIFTRANYNSPQTVTVRPAFTVDNYIAGTVPSLSTLSHSASSVATQEVQVGVLNVQPIRDRVDSALEGIYPAVEQVVYNALCAATPLCRVAGLGRTIGNLINEIIEDTPIEEVLDEVLEPIFEKILEAEEALDTARTKYQEEGIEGLVEYVSDQFTSSGGNPAVPAVSGQPRAAVQARIGARSAPGFSQVATTVGDSDPSPLEQVLEHSAHYLAAHHQDLDAGGFNTHHALALLGTDFNIPLSSFGIARQDGATDGAAPANRNTALWGSVDYSQFGDSADNFSTDGANWTFTVGVDGRLKPELLAGVALSHSTARSDYHYFGSAMGGDYDVDLTVVSPYLNWSAGDQLGLWTSVGYGKGSSRFSLNSIGELELSAIDELDQAATRQEQDSDFFSFAGGLRWEAFHTDATQLAIKLAGATTSFLEKDSQQGRLATELSRDLGFSNGVLSFSLDLALLLDSDHTSAMEVVAGLDWAAANDQLTVSTVARSLLFSGDRYEWGLGAALNYQAGVRPGEGLSLSLTPSFGATASQLADLDILSTLEDADLAFGQWQPTARFNAHLAYGIPTGNALLTPYTRLDMAHQSTTYGAGLRYALDDSLDLDLSASHRQRSSGNNDNRIFLQLRSDL